MSEDVFPTVDLGHCLVTGSAGFLGRHLVVELIRRGHTVRGFDCADGAYCHERFEALRGDIRDVDQVRKACEGIDTVFHTAAVLDFACFATRERRERSHSVNVGGVENILRAARDAGVARLISTSTNNVTLDGPVIDGDETWPYAKNPSDLYTRTKILGEQAVLAANDPDAMLTCAIRPGGIYGPGEDLLFPRLVDQIAAGTLVVTLGNKSVKSDNTFIDNLVDGQIEAARHLLPGSALGGQAYFITDGVPINYFEFFRPFIEDLGHPFPKWSLPTWPLSAVATVWEFLHWAIKIPAPFMTRLEVRKIAVSHYSRIDKAKRDFGWTPPVSFDEAIGRCLPYCRELLEVRLGRRRSRGDSAG